MNNKIIITLICFILNFKSFILVDSIFNQTLENISSEIKLIIENLTYNENITEKCKNTMKEAYLGENSISYLTKLFYDSSPSFDDIKNYYNCYDNLYINVNDDILQYLTYVVIIYTDVKKDETDDDQYEKSFSSFFQIFGMCVPQNCSDEDYKNIVNFTNNNYKLINGKIRDAINIKPLKDYSRKNIPIFNSIFNDNIYFTGNRNKIY